MAHDSEKLPSKVETIHLKVYIHCEGCRKKVKKILTRMEGVYTVDINASLGKVTVMGTVDSKTLIKRLEKSGKVVEIWPSPPQAAGGKTADGSPKANLTAKAKDQGEKKQEKAQPSPAPPPTTKEEEKKSKEDTKPAKKLENGNDRKGAVKDGENAGKGENGNTPMLPKSDSGSSVVSASSKGQANSLPNAHNSPSVKANKENGCGHMAASANGSNKIAKNVDSNTAATAAVSSSTTTTTNDKNGPGVDSNNQNAKAKKVPSEGKGSHSPSQVTKAAKENKWNEAPAKDGGNESEEHGMSSQQGQLVASNGEEFFSEASSTRLNMANRNVAPLPMVLVETNETDYYMEPHRQEDYGAHMFSDENPNNCSLM